jgi:hypothetical protein
LVMPISTIFHRIIFSSWWPPHPLKLQKLLRYHHSSTSSLNK